MGECGRTGSAAAMAPLLCKSLAMALTLVAVDVSGQNSDAVVFDDQSSSAIGFPSCSCNGIINSEGRGECRTSYKGKKFCYVNQGNCRDQKKGSSSDTYWSYEACDSYQTNGLECYGLGGDKCQFPFKWDGRIFTNCTTYKSENGAAWCATRVRGKDREAVRGSLADCAAPCDYGASQDYEYPVYNLNEAGHIECNVSSDCPPPLPPRNRIVKSITEVSIQVNYCDERGVCRARYDPFCGHALGETDPRCQRCNVRFPLPEPPCIDYEVGKGTLNLEKCCNDLFNGRIGEELQEVSTTVSTVSTPESIYGLE